MSLLNQVTAGWNNILPKRQSVSLAAQPSKEALKRTINWADKPISRIRMDIKTWNTAIELTTADDPRNYGLQLLYNEVSYDALLTSQIENRTNKCLSSEFSLRNSNGDLDEEQTKFLQKLPAYRKLTRSILESNYFGYELVELQLRKKEDGTFTVDVTKIPRMNVVPQKGRFYFDYTEDKFITYRDLNEFGTYILEFNSGSHGLINKAVPHVLMKRFTQSCWSELCEIYGIPPRVLTTNTQDTQMLNRAEKMMQDMGAAAWFIIDEHEKFEWAQGVSTDGNVYKNLINLCNNETSMLFSGAIIGQDTVNGSNSKEVASQEILNDLVKSDKDLVEEYWNDLIIPAFIRLGVLKGDVRFQYDQSEDLKELWTRTKESFPFMNVNPVFVKDKFGIDVLSAKETNTNATKLNIDPDFFV